MQIGPLSREEIRSVDRIAIEEFGLPGVILMENAGAGAARLLLDQRIDGPICICAGKGNNGGDGFVMARHLDAAGIEVHVWLACNPDEIQGDAQLHFDVIRKAGLSIQRLDSDVNTEALSAQLDYFAWIVDALLGTGLTGDVRPEFHRVITAINKSRRSVFAVDLPSGLDADQGKPLGTCVQSSVTATFVAEKKGFANAGEFLGEVHVVDIGLPAALLRRF